MSWRPKEGWKNPYLKSIYPEWEEIRLAYEAGADAMLEELRRIGIGYSKEFRQLLSYPPQGKTGRLVFIPDEE